ncbi:MAG: hypothetical protein K1000chlam3_01509 [Chlamydiae bacterium]|nr:hypothetical protein [Chlamydiota bacterium]
MAIFTNFSREEEINEEKTSFDLEAALKKNAWRPYIEAREAEKILSDKLSFTYLLRPNVMGRSFSISFIQPSGAIKHDNFTLIDPIYGIWRNGGHSHVGKLEKVICDMMECTLFDLKPL